MNTDQVLFTIVNLLTLIWIFSWKGVALWHAAKHGQKKWFIGILMAIFPHILFFSMGLLDIMYLFFFAKKKMTLQSLIEDVTAFFQRKHGSK